MAIKKYTSGAWVPTIYRKYGTETDVITALPAQIIGDGQPIASCQISGNMNQNGTPTPSAPICPEECGERTGNLVDPTARITDANITTVGRIERYVAGYYDVGYFPIIQGNAYTIDSYVHAYFYTIPTIGSTAYGNMRVVGEQGKPSSFIAPITGYCCFRVDSGDSFMANNGAAALPYEPYGYKLPISCGGTMTNVYLGEQSTTRQIKKLVLTGEEQWNGYNSAESGVGVSLLLSDMLPNSRINGFCTHFTPQFSPLRSAIDGITFGTSSAALYITFSVETVTALNLTDTASVKAWLASQYTAGTPVTVWYVLAEPETAVVNEPLMKIGDYADTVAATNIPTTGTTEQFDIGTTLKPSEVSLTYHGWHEHTDTKYTE